MNKKGFIIGLICGATVGYFTKSAISNTGIYSSEEILHKVKQSIASGGKITGSWIMTSPESIERNSLNYKVYRGGITQLNEEETNNFEFLADAKTGTIIDWTAL